MSISRKAEHRLLSDAERADVAQTHYPHLLDIAPRELRALIARLRAHRDRAQTIGRQQRREMRGKSEPRGAAPARADHGTHSKAQVLAQALKRANKEHTRIVENDDHAPLLDDSRTDTAPTQAELSRKAFELAQAARRDRHPSAGRSAHGGMHSNPSTRDTVRMDPREIGRVSQATRVAQARHDTRNATA